MYYDQTRRTASIQSCWDARNLCQETLFNTCLDMGGRHVEQRHVKLMVDCIAICQVTADCMTRRSEMFDVFSSACAKVCEATAESCERIGGAEMIKCAEACRKCADVCNANFQESQSADAA